MLAMIGLVLALALLVTLAMRGWSILIAAPLCAIIVAVTANLSLLPVLAAPGDGNFTSTYMAGFTKFVGSYFIVFLLGAVFGKLMEETGSADSVAHWVIEKLGLKYATTAVVLACALLTYGGVSVFIVAFSVYPMAVSLFRQADLPRRFIPGTIAFGSVTFTMTSAGSPEIQNLIPIEYLGTTYLAGWQVSLPVAMIMAAMGFLWLHRIMGKAKKNGERFVARNSDNESRDFSNLPHPIFSLVPLLVVQAVAFTLRDWGLDGLVVALLAGVLVLMAIHLAKLVSLGGAFTAGGMGAMIAAANTGAVVGFGAVAKVSPAFDMALNAVTSLPGSPLISAAIAVTVICGLTGSASGGQTIALPLLAPQYVGEGAEQPVDPEALHRVIAIASGALDSLPHNGYVVTTIRAICGETHKDAYGTVAALTVVIPAIGTVLAVLLFIAF
ncbi:D-beta-hydroxybutyrate permease [hydrothermal vent metagenome]|uniref:D-beta-hydroxybutyrate permease n=1 Tax=hydrothermal vent metagenome TaxID=652676 RepID=A0A3B0S6P8_9ZZZZ